MKEKVAPVWEGKVYVKSAYQPMREYVEGEDMTGINIDSALTPEVGGMICVNANNFDDSWYISKEFFGENYTEIPTPGSWKDRLAEEYEEVRARQEALSKFLSKVENSVSMDMHDWNLLFVQRDIMVSYVSVLETRMIKSGILPKEVK